MKTKGVYNDSSHHQEEVTALLCERDELEKLILKYYESQILTSDAVSKDEILDATGLGNDFDDDAAEDLVFTTLYDPIEDDPQIKPIIERVRAEAEILVVKGRKQLYQELGWDLDPSGYYFGDCHSIWKNMKAILKKDYGIDWKTPEEMNPDCCFD